MNDSRRPESANKNSFLAEVVDVPTSDCQSEAVAIHLKVQPKRSSEIRRALILGTRNRTRSTGRLAHGGAAVHLFFDRRAALELRKGDSIQVAWTPVGIILTNVVVTLIKSSRSDGDSEYPKNG